MVNFNEEHRKTIEDGKVRDPNAFKETKFFIKPFGKSDLEISWRAEDHAGAITMPEYIFLGMAEQYLDLRWNYFMRYKGIENLLEVTSGDASFYFEKKKLDKEQTIQRLKDYTKGVI